VQGTSYGTETSFTTQTTPTVSVTTTPSSITTTTAIGGGTISSTGGATIITSGLVWDAIANPTIALATKTTDGTTSGTFTSSITGLTQGTTYHVRAYATNYLGTSYGPDVTFTTITTPTVSSTATVTSITGTTATSGGTITSDGGASVTLRGLVWGTSSGSSTYSVTSGTGTGTYTASITGLSITTNYFVRAFATNSVGTVYGAETSFTTLAIAPTVSATASVTSITGSTATSGGTITSDGGATVTSRGLVWGTSSGSSTYSVTSGSGTGTYTSSITGLTPGTLYYVRSYATNSVGTSYGAETSFTTSNDITIGNQVWSSSNLNVSRYRNGDIIPQVTNNSDWQNLTTGAWCWYNNDSVTYAATYGKLYNWYAVNDLRGLAPLGWHIPTDAEWTILTDYLGGTIVAGGKMKQTGTTLWTSPNTSATNTSSFSGLPGGTREYGGAFTYVGSLGGWWSASQNTTTTAWYRYLWHSVADATRLNDYKARGFSVRCVRD
jgi:uncharacterized protein (TIGR02145 family)